MPSYYSRSRLRQLRNEIDIADLIARILCLPHKIADDHFRFLCPNCSEFNTAVNPRTNLARCFRCEQNFNPIDMVMAVKDCTFREAVEYLLFLL